MQLLRYFLKPRHEAEWAGNQFVPHCVGADPRCVGQGSAVFIEAAVEDEGGEILGMADEAEDFVEVALCVAVDAAGRGGGQRW